MGSGIRDVSVTFGSLIAAVVFGLALQSCLAWFLGPAGRGSYAVCLMYMLLLSVICTFGVDGAAQYFVASKNFSVSEGVSALLTLEAAGSVLAIAVGLGTVYWLPLEFFEKASGKSFFVAVVAVPWHICMLSLLLILAAKGEFPFRALITVVQALVRLAATVLFVKILPWGVMGAVLASLITFAMGSVMVLVFLRRRYQLHWVRPTWERIRLMLGYGGRYYLAAFGTLVHFQIGVLMVALFAAEDEIGVFSAGVTMITYVIIVSDVVGGVIHPRIARDPGGRPELAAQCARLVGVVSMGIVLVLVVLAKPLVPVYLGPDFLPAVPIIWILAPGVVYRAGTKVLAYYMKATDHPGVFSASTITSVVVNLGLLLILLPIMGLNGAALAMSAGYICGGTVVVVGFRKFSGLSFAGSWLPRKADLTLFSDSFRKIRAKVLRV